MSKQAMEMALEALEESHALNVNWVSVAEPEMLEHLSEYRAVIKMGEAAIAALKEAIKQAGEPVTYRAWDDVHSRWLFTLWPDEYPNNTFEWLPLYTSAQTIPKGWRLVPEELTDAQLHAACASIRWYEQEPTARAVYAAALAKAPAYEQAR